MHVLSDPGTTVDEREEALRMFQEEAYLLQTLRNVHIPPLISSRPKVCGWRAQFVDALSRARAFAPTMVRSCRSSKSAFT
jgi:hypothetical protein